MSTQACHYCSNQTNLIVTYDNGPLSKDEIETVPVCKSHFDSDPAFNSKPFVIKVIEI